MTSAAFASARAAQRARLIRLIHVARRDLSMEDDAYRAIVADKAAGKTSSAECAVAELERIIAHLKAAGFKVRKPTGAKPADHRALATNPEARKVRALWLLLHELGAVRNPSEAALAGYARRMAGVDALDWVRDLSPLIEGLKAWAARALPAAIDARLRSLKEQGRVDPRASAEGLARFAAPRLRPDTFDALLAAWEYLGRAEQTRPESDDVADAR